MRQKSGAGHVYEKVTCRHLFGTDGAGKAGVVRNTLNTLSLSVTNDLLSENGWRVEAGDEDFLASAAFSPASLTLVDDEAQTTDIKISDYWGLNNNIEYTLELRDITGSGNDVLIEIQTYSTPIKPVAGAGEGQSIDPFDPNPFNPFTPVTPIRPTTWETYTSGTTLKGQNTIRLTNLNFVPGQTKASLWAVAKVGQGSVYLGKVDLDLVVSDYEIIID